MPPIKQASFSCILTGGSTPWPPGLTPNEISGYKVNFCNCLGISGNAEAIEETLIIAVGLGVWG
jgi:hypothetical protein